MEKLFGLKYRAFVVSRHVKARVTQRVTLTVVLDFQLSTATDIAEVQVAGIKCVYLTFFNAVS